MCRDSGLDERKVYVVPGVFTVRELWRGEEEGIVVKRRVLKGEE